MAATLSIKHPEMAQKLQDPKNYLNSAVSNRGKSSLTGVYLTNLTVVVDASTDYGYKVNCQGVGPNDPPAPLSLSNWHHFLVNLRCNNTQQPQSFSTPEATYQFLMEGPELSLNVFMPTLSSDTFEYHVEASQALLQFVCNFTGHIASHVRFSIGYCVRSWEDLVEEGEAEERDLAY